MPRLKPATQFVLWDMRWRSRLRFCATNRKFAASISEVIIGFNVYGSVHRKNIVIYIQQDTTLHSLFYLETALHVSGGTTTHHQGRKELYLQHLVFVTPLLLPVIIVEVLELQSR